MRFALILLGLLVNLSTEAQHLTFHETRHDFGILPKDEEIVFHDFQFTNTGKSPVKITNVIVSCGCSSSAWSNQVILPGQTGQVRFSYHPQGRQETQFAGIAEVYVLPEEEETKQKVYNLYLTGKINREKALPFHQYSLPAVSGGNQPASYSPADDYERILQQIRTHLFEQTDFRKNDLSTQKYIASLQRPGKWADIDYTCYFRTNWEPVEHLKRISGFAFSYVYPQSRYQGNDSLFSAIQDALTYWTASSPQCYNWWYNQIAVPQELGNILVLLDAGRQKLPGELKEKLYRMMAGPDPRKWTGANKLDIAMHHIQRGALLKNDSIVQTASEQAFYPIRITDAEGIQEDLSYQQHGHQMYIGSYGTVFTEGEVKVASWLKGTAYALQGSQLELFRQFILSTYLNIFRGKYADFSTLGRGISRTRQLDKHATVKILQQLQELDTAYAQAYQNAQIRFQPGKSGYLRQPANQIYWRSDYALHNRKKYDFSVRTSSVRTQKTESGNGENLKGGYLADGATNIRVNGNEYFHIFPVWDWNKIPGVTAPQVPHAPVDWGTPGTSEFSGGVSDGQYGAMAYDLQEYGIKARKAWFFFDDEVACLGAGISTGSEIPVVTCVNQCLLEGTVELDKGSCPLQMPAEGIKLAPEVTHILHDSVLYLFPEPLNVRLYTGTQSGNWNDINFNEPNQKVQVEVFKLWIEHPRNATDDRYAYIVVPGVNSLNEYPSQNLDILVNNSAQQAVYHSKLEILQVIFYEPGTLRSGKLNIEVDRPCVVMIRQTRQTYPDIFVADPLQQTQPLKIQFRGKSRNFRQVVPFSGNGKTIQLFTY